VCKDIYITLTMTGTYISKLLNIFYKKEYVHTSIAFDEELENMYSFGRRNMLIPIIGGLVKEDISKGIFTKHEIKCEILRITVTEEQYVCIEELINNYMKDYYKYKYNLIGLIFIYLNIKYERRTHFTCSQFLAMVLEKSDIYKFEESWSLIKPMDFEKLRNIEIIYKGTLKNYRKIWRK